MGFPERDIQKVQEINKAQNEYFSRNFDIFNSYFPEGVKQRLKTIVKLAHIRESDIVLDVGTGTGVLIPLIGAYHPKLIYACDMCEKMLESLKKKYGFVKTILCDIKELTLVSQVDIVFMNACYPNIVEKHKAFKRLSELLKKKGRLIISHPMGKLFVKELRDQMSFPIDDFPEKEQASRIFQDYSFKVIDYRDEASLFVLILEKK